MTIATAINKNQYTGNDSTTVFPYEFRILDAAWLEVYVSGTDDPLILDTDYTVSGVGAASGGNVTYPISGDPLPTGDKITIIRVTPSTQGLDLVNQGTMVPQNVEDSLDQRTCREQDLEEKIERLDLPPPTMPEGEVALTETTADLLYVRLNGSTMNGPIDMATNQITSLADGTASGDGVNKGQLDTVDAKFGTHKHTGGDGSEKILYSNIDSTGAGAGSLLTVHTGNVIQAHAPYAAAQLSSPLTLTTSYADVCSLAMVVPRATTYVSMSFDFTVDTALTGTQATVIDLKFLRDSTQVVEVTSAWGYTQSSGPTIAFTFPGSLTRIHQPGSATTFTFKVQAKIASGSQAADLNNAALRVNMWG